MRRENQAVMMMFALMVVELSTSLKSLGISRALVFDVIIAGWRVWGSTVKIQVENCFAYSGEHVCWVTCLTHTLSDTPTTLSSSIRVPLGRATPVSSPKPSAWFLPLSSLAWSGVDSWEWFVFLSLGLADYPTEVKAVNGLVSDWLLGWQSAVSGL